MGRPLLKALPFGLAILAALSAGCSSSGDDTGSQTHAPPPGPNANLTPPRASHKKEPVGPSIAMPAPPPNPSGQTQMSPSPAKKPGT